MMAIDFQKFCTATDLQKFSKIISLCLYASVVKVLFILNTPQTILFFSQVGRVYNLECQCREIG
jgi:hypothetical protein